MEARKTNIVGKRSPEEWEEFLQKEAASILEDHHAPGVAVLLVSGEDQPLFEKCWGLARVEPAVHLQLDTPIRAGSISKVVTAIAVQQLVESGKLSLATRIGGLLDWELPYNYGQVTICDLLTHRAGIGERFARQSTPQAAEIVDLSGYLQTSLPPPVAEAGETVTYSNFGISLAGLAVEELAGMNFAAYAREKIFKPLGMNEATFILDAETERNLAAGYNWIFDRHRQMPLRHWKPYPASSLVATPRELGLLMQLFLNPGKPSPVLESPEALLEEQFSPVPGVPGMGLSFWLDEIHGQRVAWHTGHMPGHRTGFYIFPEAGMGIVFYYNTDKKVLRQFLDNFSTFAFTTLTNPKQVNKTLPTQTAKNFRDYRGIYRHSWYPHHHFGKSSAFLGKEGEELNVNTDTSGKLLAISGERYESLDENIWGGKEDQKRIGFIRDKANRITGLYMGGRDRFEKISPFESRKAHTSYALACVTLNSLGFILIITNLFIKTSILPSVTCWGLMAMCGANLGFMGLMTLLTSLGGYKVTEDVPASVGVTLFFPILGAGIWVLTLIHFIINEVQVGVLSIAGIFVIMLITLTEGFFLWFLNYWKLLGWRYL